jgi:hypothetical protein
MQTIYLLQIIFIIVFVYVIYDMYDYSCLFSDCGYDDETVDIKETEPKARTQPIKHLELQGLNNIENNVSKVITYSDNQYVHNDGFVNELMYKPKGDILDLEDVPSSITDDDIPLNEASCELSSDLPIANINVNYLLDKKTSKLLK